MNFSEALKLLREHERIARNKWNKKMYIQKKDEKIESFSSVVAVYDWSTEMFLSDDWIIDNDESILVPFDVAIEALKIGKKVKLLHWKDMHIAYNAEMRDVLLHYYDAWTYHPNFEDICATDWERF